VAVIAAALGNRARRTLELIVGVLVGIAAGDLLIKFTGTGSWQTGVIVFLAVLAAALARGPGALMTQAGGTAVLIATLTPANPDLELPRTINALIGGAVGLLVALVLVPLRPLRTVRRAADPVLDAFARHMAASAKALVHGDADAAQQVLHRMRAPEPRLKMLREVVTAAQEVARLSPVRLRRRPALDAYSRGTDYMGRAFRNSRGLVRRIGTALRNREPVPADLPVAIEHFAEAIRLLREEFLSDREPVRAREQVLHAVRKAGKAYRQDLGFSGTVVVSQLRIAANDLLRATGVAGGKARRMVRRAAGGA